jgi:hypothetical protein
MGANGLPAVSRGPRVLVPEVVWPRRTVVVVRPPLPMAEPTYAPAADLPVRGLFVDLYA